MLCLGLQPVGEDGGGRRGRDVAHRHEWGTGGLRIRRLVDWKPSGGKEDKGRGGFCRTCTHTQVKTKLDLLLSSSSYIVRFSSFRHVLYRFIITIELIFLL